ncbi:uncharacterized protein TA13940 [Theileria annulata]|uniref:Uncharacterized protein n=1 Tax=Theileria annulata TaxID=5874 RepID=Q4UET1_THEAN|nr:uncharacterized protein TA13940 [Theileria annulata]CAI74408.1 hypothetical protein TA13940 [Theileria annulata]|eukprot:XP_952140.1 hypothetical protein TA13940 [Theileria annulata]
MQPNGSAPLEDTSSAVPCTVSVAIDNKTLTINYGDNKCIEITLGDSDSITKAGTAVPYGHILTESFDMSKVHWPEIISPTLMVIVVIVFLIATIFPPVIIAVLRLRAPAWSPQHNLGGRWGLWTKYDYAPDWNKPSETTTVHAYLWHFFDLLMDIKISLAVVFIYSLQFGTTQSWDGYDTTRNTSLDFKVTLNATSGSNTFASSGSIKITVGAADFATLTGTNVQVTNIGGTIKKYIDSNKPPDPSNLQPITNTSDPLNKGTKLEIDATGSISSITAEVTIKGDLTVSSTDQKLGSSALTLGGSEGLGGTITPQDSGTKVTIKNTSTITLTRKALTAIQSLTQNAVTLDKTGGGQFTSKATITITRGEDNKTDYNFTALTVTTNLEINITQGTIKNATNTLQTTSPELDKDDVLELNATGTITKPVGTTGDVKLAGTIVVTSDKKQIGSSLTITGGPSGGVGGTLNLTNQTKTDTIPAHVTISSSTLTIDKAAYDTLKSAGAVTPDSLKIGASDSKVRIPANATGGAKEAGLANEPSFKKYWHLFPPNYYDEDFPYWTSIFPALMVLLIATIFPPMIVVILQKEAKTHSPKYYMGWGDGNLRYWHLVDLLLDTQEAKVKEATYTPPTGAPYKYIVKDPKTNITYTFTTTAQLTSGAATITVTVDYGHIFAEGFGDLEDVKTSKHVEQESEPEKCNEDAENQSDNLVHAWIWHFFVILVVVDCCLWLLS